MTSISGEGRPASRKNNGGTEALRLGKLVTEFIDGKADLGICCASVAKRASTQVVGVQEECWDLEIALSANSRNRRDGASGGNFADPALLCWRGMSPMTSSFHLHRSRAGTA